MEITVARLRLADDSRRNNDAIRAFADINLDESFHVKGLKVVQIKSGRLIVAMPSLLTYDRCPTCETRTPCNANYCGHCGCELPGPRNKPEWLDLVHPICSSFRLRLERIVLTAYLDALFQNERTTDEHTTISA